MCGRTGGVGSEVWCTRFEFRMNSHFRPAGSRFLQLTRRINHIFLFSGPISGPKTLFSGNFANAGIAAGARSGREKLEALY